MINEIRIQRELRKCGNTIRLFKIFESETYLNLLMEYEEGGTLGEVLEKHERLSEENARIIIEQLLLSIDFMSRKGIIHRDLKPENILLNSKREGIYDIRIADFGFATHFDPNNPGGDHESR
jgi:serine/threonine protein kinase